MSNKYCSKKGHHQGRLIEAICLRPQCIDDRLLCFYCKHQNHRSHETAYFPKGLPASLQTLNQNNRIENSQKQRRKIERKLSDIKKGWQGVRQTMQMHIHQIENLVNEENQIVCNTFLPDSVIKIKEKLSTQELPRKEVEKYVKMINCVSEFELNNPQKAIVWASIKERALKDIFAKAALEISKVMKEFEDNSQNLNFTSDEMEKCYEEYLDHQKGNLKGNDYLIGDGRFFENEDSLSEFEKRLETESDQTSSLHSSPSTSENKFKIVIDNKNQQESCDNTKQNINEQIASQMADRQANLQSVCESEQKESDRLQYRNILKFKNSNPQSSRQQFQGFDQNAILCCRKMSLSKEDQFDEEQEQVNSLGKSKKRIKLNTEARVESSYGTRSMKKRMNDFFKEILPNDISSSDSDSDSEEHEKIQPVVKAQKSKSNAVYGSFDFSDLINANFNQSKKQYPAIKQSLPGKQVSNQSNQQLGSNTFIEERFIQIHRKLIKLPENSHPQTHQSHFIYPNVKIYGHTLDEIYESLTMLDPQVITQLQIYCDTTTLCLDTECVEVIIKMKKLKSLMVYMTYQMCRTDVKKIIKNLPMLEELVFSEYNKMDEELAKLIRDRLPSLRRFFYTIDERNYMQKIEENLEFFIDFKMNSTSLQVINILADIPSLETIEIININNKIASRIPNVLRKMKNLKQVCIKNTNNSQSNSTDIVNYLANSNIKLQVFCAHNTTFKEQSLVKIIEKNKNLHTLIINECLQLRNQTMSVLSRNCPNLKQLSLMLIDSINGREICTFTELKTLVLRGCWQIDHQYFLRNMHKLSELQFLSVSLNNYWFYDHFMSEVVKLSKLKFLNLDTTKVSDAGIKDLHKLQQLETLICGKTEVTFERLIKSLKGPYANSKNWTIRKLGLSKDESYSKEVKTKGSKNKHDLQITEFEAKNLIALGKALPGLTHLSIGGFVNPKKEYFETLTNLKCLFVTKKQLASETENWLVSKGVYINEDY